MTIRAYTADDFPIVEQWAKARNMTIVPQLLSPNGFLVEDEHGPLAVCWVYLIFDCPRASIDDFYARLCADAWKIKQAWHILERAVIAFLSKLRDCNGKPIRYPVLTTFADAKLAAFLKSDGWHVGEKAHYHILKPINYDFV
jgi:hypothetical protein